MERKFVFKKPASTPSNTLAQNQAENSIKNDLLKKKPEILINTSNNNNKTVEKSSNFFPKPLTLKQQTPAPKPPTLINNIIKSKPTTQSSLLNFFGSKDNKKPQTVQKSTTDFDLNDEDDFEKDFIGLRNKQTSISSTQKPFDSSSKTNNKFNFNEKKPVAAVKPQINYQPQNVVKSPEIIKPTSAIVKPAPEIITAPKVLSYDDYCQICQIKYDIVNKTSQHRKVTDACGHNICLNCLLNGKLCKKCHQKDEIKESSSKSNNKKEKNDGDEEFIIDFNPKKSTIVNNNNNNFQLDNYLEGIEDAFFEEDDDEETENKKLSELGKKLTKTSISTTSSVFKSPLKEIVNSTRDLIYVDSDDDDLIIEESIPGDSDISYLGKSNNSSSIADKILNNLIPDLNDYEDDDECEIEELNDEEIQMFNSNKFNKHITSNTGSKNDDIIIPDLSSYNNSNWMFNDIKDSSSLYRDMNYPHIQDLFDSFRNIFGLKMFRPQQFEAINAALLGNHVFVLMPTGGGKSLCYQLPSILTPGVTFIVSPLKSLIIDQVEKLNALNVPAAHLLSELNGKSSESDQIYLDLNKKEPTLRIVYVTPEKLNNSDKLRNILSSLYNRNMIARLVIDEAHCISSWGHDFRPDYKQLGAIRNRLFPNVPMMLLTATATPRVRKDILLQMNLLCENDSNQQKQAKSILYHKNQMGNHVKQYCAFFMQSFNRKNLQYSVQYKTSNKNALDKILDTVKTKFPKQCGIVYCISRNECESVSDFLRNNGLKSLAYHAGMTDKQRNEIQNKWMNNLDCKIVCATIAFGMGIDKADVRFVIHLGLPKSLEGYYQESGRAGRDGLKSSCILYYNNQDRHKWLRLMQQEQKSTGNNYEVYKVHLDNLYRMSQYCDNHTDCRRTQILEYFGEIFDRKNCIENKQTLCDNCIAFTTNAFKLTDITAEARKIVDGVRKLNNADFTLLHIAEVLKGSKNNKVMEKQHDELEMHGILTGYKKNDIERIIRKLIFDGYLKEDVKILQHTETVASYIKIGQKASSLLNGNVKIQFDLRANERESQEDSEGCSKVSKQTKRKSLANSSSATTTTKEADENKNAQNRIFARFFKELKLLASKICASRGIKTYTSIYSQNMIKEMMFNRPKTRDEILKITGFTEAIWLNYQGEAFLSVIKHFAKQLDDLTLVEALENPNQQKKTSNINRSDINNIFDKEEEEEEEDNNWLTSKTGNGSMKRNAQQSSKKPTKKARSDYCNNEEDEDGGNTSSYFKKKSQYTGGGSYKKNWKFKKKKGSYNNFRKK